MIFEHLGAADLLSMGVNATGKLPGATVASGAFSVASAAFSVVMDATATAKIAKQSREMIEESRKSVDDALDLRMSYINARTGQVEYINAVIADRENNPVKRSLLTNKILLGGGLVALLLGLS